MCEGQKVTIERVLNGERHPGDGGSAGTARINEHPLTGVERGECAGGDQALGGCDRDLLTVARHNDPQDRLPGRQELAQFG
ncbi:MAG: hypothetical protein U1F46_12620 [Marinagarivorans sp.]